MPILRQTARRLDEARQQIDRVSGRDITAIVLQDPLLAIRVLAYIQSFGSKRLRSDVTNIATAVMMLGVEPFFRKFENPATIETMLGRNPQALLGVLQVVRALPARVALRPRLGLRPPRHERSRKLRSQRCSTTSRKSCCGALLPNRRSPSVPACRPARACAAASVQCEVLGFPLSRAAVGTLPRLAAARVCSPR
ncbi:MAG: HDOD domain-containing protein [Candidatus Accumulibacter meliphilus]|uniref:HDOD domain-containing protein n=1 Tax=Candidatus Accumulibacter meliphilus TaxID=2211374 RepID=UPI002FC385A7